MKEYAKLHTGERLGDYTIDRILGKGGMGAVYLVHDAKGAPFAAKVMMLPDDDDRREWRRRFAKEAGFAMTVHHKNLVAVHDMGEVEATGICYIIMDYMPGGTLSDLLKRKGQLGVREAVDIAIAIASVLEVAHGVGAVHRDIKPDNILFDADGTPKLTDMGIAKFGGANGATTVTATGVIVGTPAYMSPEQMMDSHSVDARADIYSLGLVLYEMLTGTRPHADSTVVELIAKAIKGEELPDIRTVRPEVSVALSYVLSLMVAVKPEQRIASAMEAAKMLYDAATDRIVMKRRPARLSATAVNGRMRGLKAVAVWTIGGIMFVSAIAVGAWWMNKPENPGVQQAPQPGDPPKTSGGDEKPGGGGEISGKDEVKEKSVVNTADFDIRDGVLRGTKLRGVDEIVVPSGVKSVCIDGLVHSGVKTIIIPEGVKHIGRVSGGYYPGTKLEEVRLPASVSSLAITAFDGYWRKLKKITVAPGSPYVVRDGCLIDTRNDTLVFALPSNGKIVVPDTVKTIGEYAFNDNSVEEVVVPNSVVKIDRKAFDDCRQLERITLPASVAEIGKDAFSNCGKLVSVDIAPGNERYATKDGLLIDMKTTTLLRAFGPLEKVVIPSEVKTIGEGSFSFLKSLTSMTVPDTVNRIEDDAFSYCSNMIELRLPARVGYCGGHFIMGCKSLMSVKIPMGMTELAGNYSIGGCKSLRELVLPRGLQYIGAGGLGAVCECDMLERIYIPASVVRIASGSGFAKNPSLKEFDVDSASKEFCSDSGVLFSKAKTRLIRCPEAKEGVYTIPNTVLQIDACAFNGCRYLTEIRIPDSVREIGYSAFGNCTAITNRYHSTEIKGENKPTSNVDGVKLPVGSMPKVGLMVAYDYDGGSAVNFGYGTAAVLREDVSYRDGGAVFDGKYQASKGDDVVIPGFNYDHFSVALSFMPNKEKFSRHFLRIGSLAYGMLDMVPSKRSGEQLRISFSDLRMEKISLPIEIGKWNWVVLSVDVKKRIVMVAVNGVPPVERILPEGFYWTIPSGDIAGDRFRRIHFGNANCGVRYCGAIDDLMVYDRALTQRELQDIVRGVPYGGSATASASPGSSPLVFPRARPVDGKWVLARQPEMSQYWNGTITMGGITLGVREDKDGLAVPPIGKLSHETIDLSRPVVDEDGKEFPIYAIGSPFDGVYCAVGSSVKTIRLPQSLRELRSLAIAGCSRLETISLPNTLEIIGDSAFYFCSSLESVVIPENVRQVGARAFESCGSLAKVEILSKSVTIAKDAFARGTPVGSAVPKENWTTGPVTKEVRGDPTLAYAKKGRMKEPLFFFSHGGIRFGESHGDVGGWGSTPMRGQRSLGEFDIHFHKVGPGLLAGIELTWRKKCEVEGNAEEAVAAASKIISILKSKLNGNIDTPRILPKSEWPEYGDMGNFYAMYEQIKAIGTSESEVNGYKVKVNVYCGRKDKNVAVVISVIDSYMFKAWGAPAPGE